MHENFIHQLAVCILKGLLNDVMMVCNFIDYIFNGILLLNSYHKHKMNGIMEPVLFPQVFSVAFSTYLFTHLEKN